MSNETYPRDISRLNLSGLKSNKIISEQIGREKESGWTEQNRILTQ
jgi:hypothetical protein